MHGHGRRRHFCHVNGQVLHMTQFVVACLSPRFGFDSDCYGNTTSRTLLLNIVHVPLECSEALVLGVLISAPTFAGKTWIGIILLNPTENMNLHVPSAVIAVWIVELSFLSLGISTRLASKNSNVRFPSDFEEDTDASVDSSSSHSDPTASIASYTPTNSPTNNYPTTDSKYGSKYLLNGFSLFDLYPMLHFTISRPPFLGLPHHPVYPTVYPTMYPTLYPTFFPHSPPHFEQIAQVPPLEEPTAYNSVSVDSLMIPLIGLIGLDLMEPDILLTRRLPHDHFDDHLHGPRETTSSVSTSTDNPSQHAESAVVFPDDHQYSSSTAPTVDSDPSP